jgi:hypothetical protein
MIGAKDEVRPLLRWVASGLALGLSLAELGCTAVTGLRSAATDRLPLLDFWDRSPRPAPDPADDYYAQYMHAAKDRADALAKRSADTNGRIRNDAEQDQDTPGDERIASTDRATSTQRSSARSRPVRDETIQVTLGRPEPLPTLASLTAPESNLATTRPSPRWQGNPRPSDLDARPAPRLAREREPGDRREPAETIPSRSTRQPARPAFQDSRTILAQSEAKLRSLNTYQVKISRVERVGGRLQPEEEILLSIRRDPKAVRLEWAVGPNQGREVIYSSQLDQRSLFVHLPSSAIPLPPMKIAVDSPMVMKNSRHSITEAGFDTIVENLRKSMVRKGSQEPDPGELVYQGLETPPGLDRPGHRFTRRSPSGETWTVYLDARTLLPCMVLAKNSSGEVDERYVYHDVRENPTELASANAFDPDQRWGESKGLLSRFARSAAGALGPNTRQSTLR